MKQYEERLKYISKTNPKKQSKGLFSSVSHTTKEDVDDEIDMINNWIKFNDFDWIDYLNSAKC